MLSSNTMCQIINAKVGEQSDLLLRITNTAWKNREVRFHFWKAGRVVNLAGARVPASLLQLESKRHEGRNATKANETNRVVDACAIMLPPIGFFSLAYGPAAASGLDMT